MVTIFEAAVPRDDVRTGAIADGDFAARLADAVRGSGSADYAKPELFFANTYPTAGLKELLDQVCRRLSGAEGSVASVFRLDTSFGGGKTHALIALVHAARGMIGVAGRGEFLDEELLPASPAKIAAFDGTDADPANGRSMGDGVRAHTPWGELAYQLGGSAGFERVRASDEQRVAPGLETLRELIGDAPVLIVLDELGEYLRKVPTAGGRGQLAAFLKALFGAVESAPNAPRSTPSRKRTNGSAPRWPSSKAFPGARRRISTRRATTKQSRSSSAGCSPQSTRRPLRRRQATIAPHGPRARRVYPLTRSGPMPLWRSSRAGRSTPT